MRRFWQDETGATAVEYGLIVAIVATVLLTSYQPLADAVAEKLICLGDTMEGQDFC